MAATNRAYASAFKKLSTPKLTGRCRTPLSSSSRRAPAQHPPKMRYAHQGGSNPPIGRHPRHLAQPHLGYLALSGAVFLDAFELREHRFGLTCVRGRNRTQRPTNQGVASADYFHFSASIRDSTTRKGA